MATYRLKPYDVTRDGRVRYVVQKRFGLFFWFNVRDNGYGYSTLVFSSPEAAEKMIRELQIVKTFDFNEKPK